MEVDDPSAASVAASLSVVDSSKQTTEKVVSPIKLSIDAEKITTIANASQGDSTESDDLLKKMEEIEGVPSEASSSQDSLLDRIDSAYRSENGHSNGSSSKKTSDENTAELLKDLGDPNGTELENDDLMKKLDNIEAEYSVEENNIKDVDMDAEDDLLARLEDVVGEGKNNSACDKDTPAPAVGNVVASIEKPSSDKKEAGSNDSKNVSDCTKDIANKDPPKEGQGEKKINVEPPKVLPLENAPEKEQTKRKLSVDAETETTAQEPLVKKKHVVNDDSAVVIIDDSSSSNETPTVVELAETTIKSNQSPEKSPVTISSPVKISEKKNVSSTDKGASSPKARKSLPADDKREIVGSTKMLSQETKTKPVDVKTLDTDKPIEIDSDDIEMLDEEMLLNTPVKSAENVKIADTTGEDSTKSHGLSKNEKKPSPSKAPVIVKPAGNKLLAENMNNLMKNRSSSSSVSTPNTSNLSTTTPNVFNSTPIQKQFDIPSENVSKISDTLADSTPCSTSHTDSSDIETESSEKTSQYNGITSSDGSECKVILTKVPSIPQTKSALTSGEILIDISDDQHNENNVYEICVVYEHNDMKSLIVEKLDKDRKSIGSSDSVSSGKVSSNGSVGSVGPFPIPASRASVSATSSTSASSSSSVGVGIKTEDGQFLVPQQPQRTNKVVRGILPLCNFMIEHFTAIKRSAGGLIGSDDETEGSNDPITPKVRGRSIVGSKKTVKTPPSQQRTPRKHAATADSEDEPKTKHSRPSKATTSTKASPKVPLPSVSANTSLLEETDKLSYCVLARWSDKKYYAGRIKGQKPGNKFVVQFEDGATKVLPTEHIVFGHENTLPLQDQHIHVKTGEDTYEPGLVLSSCIENEDVIYTVLTETEKVTVTVADIYLEEDQAKVIQDFYKDAVKCDDDSGSLNNAGRRGSRGAMESPSKLSDPAASPVTPTADGGRKRGRKAVSAAVSASPTTPEPGFSGGVAKKGRATRAKRY